MVQLKAVPVNHSDLMENFNEYPAPQEKKERERQELRSRNGNTVVVEERDEGRFVVIDSNVFNDEIQKIGFTQWMNP